VPLAKGADPVQDRAWQLNGLRRGLLLAALLPSFAQAALTMQLERRELALGEPLALTVSGPAERLESLDLGALQADFEIRARSLSRDARSGSLSLTLYPLRPGALVVPALGDAAGRTRALGVNVLDGSENIPRLHWRTSFEPAHPSVRQPTRFTLEVCDDGTLDWKRPALPTLEALHVRALGEEQADVELAFPRLGRTTEPAPEGPSRSWDGPAIDLSADGTCTAHRWHWAVTPLVAGAARLPLPMLEAGKFGQPLRFAPPTAAFDARPVPAWLPAEVAIGRPDIHTTRWPARWPVDRPLTWRMRIAGGYGIADIKRLLELQLAATPALRAYPPVVELLVSSDALSPRGEVSVTLHALPATRGELALPELVFPYYNPDSGRLDTLRLPGARVTIFDPLREQLAWAGAGLLALLLLALALWRARRMLVWRRARSRGLAAIAAAADSRGLAQALRGFSLCAGQQEAATLGQWRERMRAQCRVGGGRDATLDELIAVVERNSYADTPGESADALQRRALETLRAARPL
jgi:hypothetical protein